MPGKSSINWPLLFIVVILIGALFFWEARHISIETDILQSMPKTDPVLADARRVIEHLPVSDRVIIDLAQTSGDRDRLWRAAAHVEERLQQSGLFSEVGISDEARNIPDLMAHVANQMPALFSEQMLQDHITPLLAPDRIIDTLDKQRQSLEQLDGIGSASRIAADPLGFAGVLLAPLQSLLPAQGAQFYRGRLMSADGRHVLIIAHIDGSGTDTALAGLIARLVDDIQVSLRSDADFSEEDYTLSAAGAYRAALDNETIARRDTRLAIILTVLAISILLFLVFPRPLIGLLALLPSSFGAVGSLFVCSFLFDSLSILAVGFGGAILAFTVDLALTYLLFLDQQKTTYGCQVARQLWSAELLSVMTTLGAFLLLLVSDFKILAQIGVFSALGAFLALLFVHYIFPLIFPAMPPAKRRTHPRIMRALRVIAAPSPWKLAAVTVFGLVMLFFTKPVFEVNLEAMNSLSDETLAAEETISTVWGDLSGRAYLFIEAPGIDGVQFKNDRLLPDLRSAVSQGALEEVPVTALLFPSAVRSEAQYEAWRAFWTEQRQSELRHHLDRAARETGFAPDAFEPFWATIQADRPAPSGIPEAYFTLLGIEETADGFTQMSLLQTGPGYDAKVLYATVAATGLATVFDVGFFNDRLGEYLRSLFIEIALIVSIGIVVVVFFFFLDWRLSMAVLAPVAFALAATLGTLKLIGHPLDIPGLMLWIVIMGMGIDYAIYYVCMYQRYPDEKHPAMDTIKLSVFMAAATTFTGFGVLALAQHPLLKSIGYVSIFGIAYSLIGAYLILPTLMEKIFTPRVFAEGPVAPASREHVRRTVLRYRLLPGHPRIFARLKLKMDPMFQELHRFVRNPRRIIDIGCGFGVPAVWLLELYPQAHVFGLEPDEERVLIANRVLGLRGEAQVGRAPDLPRVEGRVDYILMLDMIHLITDDEVRVAFERIFDKLEDGGTLLVRATVPTGRKAPWKRWIEAGRVRIAGLTGKFRSEDQIVSLMEQAGFEVTVCASPVFGVEELWFTGRKQTG